MSGHLVAVAGYVELPPTQKLALMKICDSADQESRVGFPGLDAIRMWAGVSKTRAAEILVDLQARGLLMQTQTGHRGQRAAYKVFPDPGDEKESVAWRCGEPCPGLDLFAGSPGIPKRAEVGPLADQRTATKPRKGFVASEPFGGDAGGSPEDVKAPTHGSQSASDPSEASPEAKGPVEDEKASGFCEKASDPSEPFSTTTSKPTTSKTLGDAAAPQSVPGPQPASEALFDADTPAKPSKTRRAPKPRKEPDPVNVEANRITSIWWDELTEKPIGERAFQNVAGLVATSIRAGKDPERQILPALRACGMAVTGAALNFQFQRQRDSQSRQFGGQPRVARSDQQRWNNGRGKRNFKLPGKEAS